MTMSDRQRDALIAVLEDVPWVDIEGAVATVDEGLAFALDLTAHDFRFWHDHIEPLGYEDEFNRTLMRDLPPEWKPALVARLLRSIAMSYGLTTDYASGPNGLPSRGCTDAAEPLRRILEVI